MSDERLIRGLRALDRPVDVDPGFGEALFATLEGEFDRRRQFRPRLTLLLVAALVVALLVGGAIAVGSGLLRLRWTSDHLVVPSVAGCPADLPDGQVLELVVNEGGYVDPSDEWGPTAGSVIRVYDDGLLLTAGHGRTVEQIRAGDSGMTARRLSQTGIRLILEAADESAFGSGCNDRWADTHVRVLTVRGEDGGVGRVAWGRGSSFIRQMTYEEQEAAERLVARLEDPESWLPADAWIDATARPYVPNRWLVNVQLPETYADPEGALDRPLSLPNADEMALPGGTALLALGDPYQEPDGVEPPRQPGLRGRCAVIGVDLARSFTEAFADAGAVAFNQNWWFRHDSDSLGVAIRPLLPTDEGCTARVLGLAELPGPPPTPLAQPSGDLALAEPCGFLSEASVRTTMDVPAARPIVIADRTARDEIWRLGPEYRVCSYRLGEIWDDPSTVVHVRTSSTNSTEARVLAHEILGESAPEEAVADRTVWRNGCGFGQPFGCTPAIVISVEPYFIVITFEGHVTGDLPRFARGLASVIATDR